MSHRSANRLGFTRGRHDAAHCGVPLDHDHRPACRHRSEPRDDLRDDVAAAELTRTKKSRSEASGCKEVIRHCCQCCWCPGSLQLAIQLLLISATPRPHGRRTFALMAKLAWADDLVCPLPCRRTAALRSPRSRATGEKASTAPAGAWSESHRAQGQGPRADDGDIEIR